MIKYKRVSITEEELKSHLTAIKYKIAMHYEERGVNGINIGYIEYLDSEIKNIEHMLYPTHMKRVA
jgi:hypothetical protein